MRFRRSARNMLGWVPAEGIRQVGVGDPAEEPPEMEIRFYEDPVTGLPHIYGHDVTEEEVR